MPLALKLLDQAIALAERELNLLEGEEADGLEESAAKREGLLEQAWEKRAECDEQLYAAKLARLQEMQRCLDERANALRQELQNTMKQEKEMDAGLQGYGLLGRKKRDPYFFSKQS